MSVRTAEYEYRNCFVAVLEGSALKTGFEFCCSFIAAKAKRELKVDAADDDYGNAGNYDDPDGYDFM